MSEYLQTLAAEMKRNAQKVPGKPQTPARPLKNGAQLTLRFYAGAYQLRIARRGLSPFNDFSANGAKRLAAWRREIETFCREFDVPAEHAHADGAQELIYFVDVIWTA